MEEYSEEEMKQIIEEEEKYRSEIQLEGWIREQDMAA